MYCSIEGCPTLFDVVIGIPINERVETVLDVRGGILSKLGRAKGFHIQFPCSRFTPLQGVEPHLQGGHKQVMISIRGALGSSEYSALRYHRSLANNDVIEFLLRPAIM